MQSLKTLKSLCHANVSAFSNLLLEKKFNEEEEELSRINWWQKEKILVWKSNCSQLEFFSSTKKQVSKDT